MLFAPSAWFRGATDNPGARAPKWVIEPIGEGLGAKVAELWRYRRILAFLSVRAIKSVYQGMTLGIFWLFARPLLPIAISAFVFGKLLNVPSDGLPYFLFFLAGMTSWFVMEQSLLMITKSLDGNKGMIKKVYFPRLIAPISSLAPAIVFFGIYLGLLFGTLVYYLVVEGRWYLRFGPEVLMAPAVTLLTCVLVIGLGLFTCVWQVRHREVRYSIRFMIRFWFYLTPVIYPLSLVPPEHHWLLYLNPMAPFVETFKWSLFGVGTFPVAPFASAVAVVGVVLAAGIWYFHNSEAAAVDRM